MELLYVDGVLFFLALFHRWLGKCLSATKFFYHTGLLIFAFEFFQGSFNIFTLF